MCPPVPPLPAPGTHLRACFAADLGDMPPPTTQGTGWKGPVSTATLYKPSFYKKKKTSLETESEGSLGGRPWRGPSEGGREWVGNGHTGSAVTRGLGPAVPPARGQPARGPCSRGCGQQPGSGGAGLREQRWPRGQQNHGHSARQPGVTSSSKSGRDAGRSGDTAVSADGLAVCVSFSVFRRFVT